MAVVGLGSIAQSSVLPAFANCRRAKLAAVVSRDKNKAARLAQKFGANTAYSNAAYEECLANPAVAAVYIATPQGEHADLAVRAAEAGKHVLCEKPLAATVEQSAAMVKACRDRGVVLMTAYRKFFEPASCYLKKIISRGDLGRIDVIHTAFSELFRPGITQAWLLDPSLAGGGPLMDLGVYCVNTCRWLVDEDPLEVSAQSWRHDASVFREVEQGIAFRMNFASGLVLLGSSSYGAAPSSFINVQGTKGWVSLNPAFAFEEERRVTGKIRGRWFERTFPVIDEFALELDAFAAAVQGTAEIEPDGMQGHRDVVIMHAIYESAESGKPVRVNYR
jgi:predicted dehydrogenase